MPDQVKNTANKSDVSVCGSNPDQSNAGAESVTVWLGFDSLLNTHSCCFWDYALFAGNCQSVDGRSQ